MPSVSEITTVKKTTIPVLIAARQNSRSIQAPSYPFSVKVAPVSTRVRNPKMALVQSAFEKKSPCTLNDPQAVHRKGKTAIISQKPTNAVEMKIKPGERLCAAAAMPPLLRRSFE